MARESPDRTDGEDPVSALDPSQHVAHEDARRLQDGEPLRSVLAAERKNVGRQIRDFGHQIERHRVASTIAGMAMAGAAAVAGIAPTALGAVSAFVVYRILCEEHARAASSADRPGEEPLWLTGYCPDCGQHVISRAPAPGERREMRCSQGHLMHRVETLPLR